MRRNCIIREDEATLLGRTFNRVGEWFRPELAVEARAELVEMMEIMDGAIQRSNLLWDVVEAADELLRLEKAHPKIYAEKRGELTNALTELRAIGWVPRADEPFDYDAYLASPEWQARREVALGRCQGRCQLCNSPERPNVHHRTYERIGREIPEDLTVLCSACHGVFHDRRKLFLRKDPE